MMLRISNHVSPYSIPQKQLSLLYINPTPNHTSHHNIDDASGIKGAVIFGVKQRECCLSMNEPKASL
jgi:hypothetical protein